MPSAERQTKRNATKRAAAKKAAATRKRNAAKAKAAVDAKANGDAPEAPDVNTDPKLTELGEAVIVLVQRADNGADILGTQAVGLNGVRPAEVSSILASARAKVERNLTAG